MSAEASNLPESVPNFQESELYTQGGRGLTPYCVFKGPDWSIFTGLYKNVQQIYGDDKQAVFYEKNHLNILSKSQYKRINASATNSE